MPVTWGEVKQAALQKLFAVRDGVSVTQTVQEYTEGMPQAANEGLALLCAENLPLRRCFTVTVEAVGPRTVQLADLAADFWRAGEPEAYRRREDGRLVPAGGFAFAAGRLLIPESWRGEYEVWYDAFPPRLTADTPDGEELPVEQQAAVILPLYMASQLYKDDDGALAAAYRNEFEAARAALRPASVGVRAESWASLDGWA